MQVCLFDHLYCQLKSSTVLYHLNTLILFHVQNKGEKRFLRIFVILVILYPIIFDNAVDLLCCKILGYVIDWGVLTTVELSSEFRPGDGGLTRKRRRASRSRWWGRGSGRRLLSAGPSSLVRRSRTCFSPAASPIFAPFALSSPPTCCPLLSALLLFYYAVKQARISRQNSGVPSNISEALFWKVSQSHNHCLLIHTLGSWSQSSHLPLSVCGNQKRSWRWRLMFFPVIRPRWLLHPEIGPWPTDIHIISTNHKWTHGRAAPCARTPRRCRASRSVHMNVKIKWENILNEPVLAGGLGAFRCALIFPHPKGSQLRFSQWQQETRLDWNIQS